jgi:hypothetical protein
MVVGGFGGLDWIVEYVAVPMLGDLRMDHGDHRLETLERNLFFRPARWATTQYS